MPLAVLDHSVVKLRDVINRPHQASVRRRSDGC